MTRRGLITGLAAAAAYRRLQGQSLTGNARLTKNAKFTGAIPIPSGPIARWNFSTLGLADQATISSVKDQTGNGNDLTPWTTGQSAQAPMYTTQAMNGKGAFWPGSLAPGGVTVQTPTCAATGALTSPNLNPTLQESPMTVLFAFQGGTSSSGGHDGGGMFTIGQLRADWRSGNAGYPHKISWSNLGGTRGAFSEPADDLIAHGAGGQIFSGPVAGAIVNGFGGTAGLSRFMYNRYRNTFFNNLGWTTAAAGAAPAIIGFSTFSGNNIPQGYLYHEIVVYNRALTEAELDAWTLYCNQQYGSPLCRSVDSAINRRVLIIGDSLADSQNAVLGMGVANYIAQALGNTNHVEYINYGSGSTTSANWLTNIASYNIMAGSPNAVGPVLTSAQCIAVIVGGVNNDFQASLTAQQVHDNIASVVASLKANGWGKVIVCGQIPLATNTVPEQTFYAAVNALIVPRLGGDGCGADAICDLSSGGPNNSVYQFVFNNMTGHYSNIGYQTWAGPIATTLSPFL